MVDSFNIEGEFILIKRILRGILNKSIMTKFILIFIISIILPIIVFSYISYNNSYKALEKRAYSQTLEITNQVIKNIDSIIENMDYLTITIARDKTVLDLLNKDYNKMEYPFYEKIQDEREVKYILASLKDGNKDIDSILIYNFGSDTIYDSSKYIYNVDNFYRPYTEEWYKKIEKADGRAAFISVHPNRQYNDSRLIVSAGRLLKTDFQPVAKGVVIVNVSLDTIKSVLESIKLSKNSRIYLMDENDNIIFPYDDKNSLQSFGSDILKNISKNQIYKFNDGKGTFLITKNISAYTGWKVLTITPINEVFSDLNSIKNIFIYITVSLLFFMFLASAVISRGIIKPIKKLEGLMNKVDSGDLNIKAEGFSEDEIGQISKSFNKMISRINELIQNIKDEERSKKEAELAALQAQINPHFMYNVLNDIKWLAAMQNANNITKSIDALVSMLKYSAKLKEDLITIEQQIDHLNNYIYIQRLRYLNKFRIEINVEEDLFDCKTLKFILQPLVENAIFHGKKCDQDQINIAVTIKRNSSCIEYTVEDDGRGIEPDVLKSILEGQNNAKDAYTRIGLKNVNERLKLYFGEEYELNIESVVDKGTKVSFRIPIIR